MTNIYVFPGQGSQRRGMGEGLFEKHPILTSQADRQLGYSIKEMCLSNPGNRLHQTEYTQPALYTVCALSYLDHIESGMPTPEFVAGHSLGEYTALFAAGAFSFIDGLKLVQHRGRLMSKARSGAMAAILGVDLNLIARLLKEDHRFKSIDIANINSRHQCVISGTSEGIADRQLQSEIEQLGGTFIPLNVSAAFHSRYMSETEKLFTEFLSNFSLKPLSIPVISNVSARCYPESDYESLITLQITQTVNWYESMSWLIHKGHTTFKEIGPGDVLTKINQHISQEPMDINRAELSARHAFSSSTFTTKEKQKKSLVNVFMYGGQGSQYYAMGRELYEKDRCFRHSMDLINRKVRERSGKNFLEALYDPVRPRSEFDELELTHPALFAIGYSLTQVLIERGIFPDIVLGHSLGEYIAAAVGETMALDDVLDLIVTQASLLVNLAPQGRLLSVIDSPDLFFNETELFKGLTLAANNFNKNFVVSGSTSDVMQLHTVLAKKNILSVMLPVKYGFHSHQIDSIRDPFLTAASGVSIFEPKIPTYSSALSRDVAAEELERYDHYLWKIIRSKVDFTGLLENTFQNNDNNFFLDLSASGSLATFIKHSDLTGVRCGSILNQFGRDVESLDRLLLDIDNSRQKVS